MDFLSLSVPTGIGPEIAPHFAEASNVSRNFKPVFRIHVLLGRRNLWFDTALGMRLSIFSDYALRVLMHAGLQRPELTTVDEVARSFGVSKNHLSKVVHKLSVHGFIATRRGIGGGFTLARPLKEISLGDVIRLTEGDETVIDCITRKNEPCIIFPACRLKGVFAEAAQAFYQVLDQYTLEDLVRRRSAMRELLGI